jgi:putative peptide maturation system protein
MSQDEYVAVEVNGDGISLEEVLISAKFSGNLQFIQDAIDTALIRQAAEQRGIEVSDDELQQAADDFRLANELNDADATEAWLTERHLSFEEWESALEDQAIAQKLRITLTEGRVEQYFAEQRLLFDSALLAHLVVQEEDLARELRAQIVEDEADFHALAHRYSLDSGTKLAGGYSGQITRADMEAAVEASVFGAHPGDVLGPFKNDDGWELIKVESIQAAKLDDSMRARIKSQLFEEWLKEQRRKAKIAIPLLEPAAAEDSDELDSDGETGQG